MAGSTAPLATLEQCFALMTTGPGALTIDGKAVRHGLPPRPIPLDELRGLLHHLSPQAQMAILDVVVRHARAGSAAWLVGLAGVLHPELRQLADQHASVIPAATAEAQALTWFRITIAASDPVVDRRIRWLLDGSSTARRADKVHSPASNRLQPNE